VDRAKRRANVAASLVALGRPEKVWPLLIHSSDPTVRSYLIERLGTAGVDPWQLQSRLAKEPDVSARRALILALGEFPADQLQSLASKLIQLYESDADAGLHAAAGWTLSRWGLGEQLKTIDHRLATGKVEGRRHWYVNKQGQTFSILRRPHPPGVGAKDEPAAFAIASTEVTVAQFREFRKDHKIDQKVAPDPDCPVNLVSWYDAVEYCNYLSETNGIQKDQWCYERTKDGLWEFVPDYRKRTGYRLPTEDEWICACQAGARTLFGFGEADEELVSQYAWWQRNGHAGGVQRCFPVASLKPNDWGLFDMHGNVQEWCQDVPTKPGIFLNDIGAGGKGGPFYATYRSLAWDRPPFMLGRKLSANHIGFRPARSFH
jgi:hypothetical protein